MAANWLLLLASLPATAATCESLAPTRLPNTTITLAQTVAAGEFKPPVVSHGAPGSVPFANLPAFCRVAGTIKPTADSNIQFEVWMPASGWNGKFQGIGNGGFAGSISYPGLANSLARGYAAASTDTGHTGGDAAWALGHREKIIDFGYRAIHEMTEKAKGIVAAFYGSGPRRSYFSSCSNGGRQALMEAQRYPADYDGIISGAPANYWTHLAIGFVWNAQAMQDPASYIPAGKMRAIEAAALAACDARDGVKDSVIDEPPKCRFDPQALLCQGPESDSCLTQPQLTALKKIYSGPRDSKGQLLFPGYPPGAETGGGGWAGWITGLAPGKGLQMFFSTQFFQNMVFDNPGWDYKTFHFDKDVRTTDEKMGPVLNATDPNLGPFQARGGKLILYHGWNDAAIAAGNTINYYNDVVAKLGDRKASGFVRLYMVPGMQHCTGGPGPNNFGQWGAGVVADPQHDMSLALERWVEEHVAPGSIIATGGSRTRPLCPYPQTAQWKGTGSTDDAANFVCK